MQHVWMTQCLCPKRHAILAAADEAEDIVEAQRKIEAPLRAKVKELLDAGTINPWCGICAAPVADWFLETGRTRFATMDEATPALAKSEVDNILTRALYGDEPGGTA